MSEDTGHVILLLDDDQATLNALRRDLLDLDAELITTTDVHEALQIIKVRSISLVISDERMPLWNGCRFLTLVEEISPATIRVLITGYTDVEVLHTAVNRAHVARCFMKPWDSEVLLESVRHLLTTYVKPDGDAGRNEDYATTNEARRSKAVEIGDGVKTDGI